MKEVKQKKQLKWEWVFTLIALFFVAGIYFFVVKKYNSEMDVLKTDMEDLKISLENKEEELQFWNSVSSYKNVDRKYVMLMKEAIPSSPDTMSLVLNMNSIASESGLKMDSISINDAENSKSQETNSKGNLEIGSVDFNINISNISYNNLKSFFEKIEKNTRIIEVLGFQFVPSSKTMNITMKAYYLDFKNKQMQDGKAK